MKDVEGVERGQCLACAGCEEYAFKTKSNQCDDCGCNVSRHKQLNKEETERARSRSKSRGPKKAVDANEEKKEKKSFKDKVSDIESSGRLGNGGALDWILKSFVVWSIVTLACTLYVLSGAHKSRAMTFNRGPSDTYYKFGIMGFAIGMFFAFLTYSGGRTPERRSLAIIMFGVQGIALISYALQLFRLTPSFMMPTGMPWDPARSFEWMACCPTLIYLIAELTRSTHDAWETMGFDYTMIAFGLFGAIMKEPYATWMDTCSCLYFLYVVGSLMKMYNAALNGETDCKLDKASLVFAKWATFCAWWGFTIIYFLQKDQVVSYQFGELLYCGCDMVAKVFLTLILINATVEQATSERLAMLTNIAAELEEQTNATDALLEKMMPAAILEQIKTGKAAEAEEFDNVTVFFSDIANFTVLSSRTSTKDMLATLNKLWLEYDAIAKKWGMYKVETIGDAYLGVAGCPERVPDHADRGCNFAIDIITMITTFKSATNESINIRIGLNSGPVTAGVMGDLNPHWCLVGDTVNIASKMESSSKPMQIHISDVTYELVKNNATLVCTPGDVVTVKGKGPIQTYFVTRK
ncbi:hypothetical protein SmJEL517_g03632 [Synchytrium microbalum]|uniref:Guanylate cyclase domain-containing protein n=1 Tax=Synchytrium microbalum TaxID=1806994 RepID=A0A507C357_9FUNG|nr:uncharacterized protein SmJEL517_g03632 [Synchytrium microbalum]TPX33479.1 hypothetical protein SmJEL517_g03632 [Synchytrium microbalum]